MRRIHAHILIWLFALLTTAYLVVINHTGLETYEEVFWLGAAGSTAIEHFRIRGHKWLIYSWAIYGTGVIFDVLDELVFARPHSILSLDTSLKAIGFLMISYGFFQLALHNRKTILRLKNEINSNRELQQKLRYEAYHDSLTGMGNRRACFDNFEWLKRHHKFLLYFDLDDFKLANDKYGHQHGDEILKVFSASLNEEFGRDHCFRVGGDEFVAFTNDMVDVNQERIKLSAILALYEVGVSIGATELLSNDLSADELLNRADTDMYHDKFRKSERA